MTVNKEDEKNREKASPEEVLLALKEQKKLRGIVDTEEKTKPKGKKKIQVVNKVKESFVKTNKEMDDF